jgi:hypothetical protein
MTSNLINYQKKHEYFNGIYDNLHPSNDRVNRVYTKPKPNFDFKFKDDTLQYSNYRELDFTKKSLDNFKTFDKNNLDTNQMSPQKKISYLLTNNLVPVIKIF